ncbi:MAG: response regulator [Tenuifilaceae bacterium]|nr:response regulator [Tenuifilaceae bacterium]
MYLKRVLLVDDVYYNRVLIDSLLTDWGFEVVMASNGKEALELLNGGNLDLVILDIMMPVMDGFEFLAAKSAEKNNIPVIVLSARNDETSINKAIELGALDYVPKPFNSEDLREKIFIYLSK